MNDIRRYIWVILAGVLLLLAVVIVLVTQMGNGGSPAPTVTPTLTPRAVPTSTPTPTLVPTPTPQPTFTPTPMATSTPTPEPTHTPTSTPTPTPTAPTLAPTAEPTVAPTAEPTVAPTVEPTAVPTPAPTPVPTPDPTAPTLVYVQIFYPFASSYGLYYEARPPTQYGAGITNYQLSWRLKGETDWTESKLLEGTSPLHAERHWRQLHAGRNLRVPDTGQEVRQPVDSVVEHPRCRRSAIQIINDSRSNDPDAGGHADAHGHRQAQSLGNERA